MFVRADFFIVTGRTLFDIFFYKVVFHGNRVRPHKRLHHVFAVDGFSRSRRKQHFEHDSVAEVTDIIRAVSVDYFLFGRFFIRSEKVVLCRLPFCVKGIRIFIDTKPPRLFSETEKTAASLFDDFVFEIGGFRVELNGGIGERFIDAFGMDVDIVQLLVAFQEMLHIRTYFLERYHHMIPFLRFVNFARILRFAFVCSWEMRDSLTLSTCPISLNVKSS